MNHVVEVGTYIIKVRGCHVPNTPALVADTLLDLLKQMLLHFSGGDSLCDGNQVLDGEKADRVLIISLQSAVNRQSIGKDVWLREMGKERLLTLRTR